MNLLLRTSIFLLMLIASVSFVAAQINGCNNGPVVFDPECGPVPENGCDVRQSTTFNPGTYNLLDGIDMCASGVTLDCNGATLKGGGLGNPPGAMGIYLIDQQGTTIKNCIIENYELGIVLMYRASDNNLINNQIIKSDAGGYGTGISISGVNGPSVGNTVMGNTISKNIQGLVLQYNTTSTTVQDNMISINDKGIYITLSQNNLIRNNDIYRNVGEGIHMVDSNEITIQGNTIRETSQSGIRMTRSTSNTVFSNVFCPSSFLEDFSGDLAGNSGDNNVCERPGAWNDDGVVGCTFTCLEIKRYPDSAAESFKREPSIPGYPRGVRLQWQVTTFKYGEPKANEPIKIELLPGLNDGGHVVEAHTPTSRPLGTLLGDENGDGVPEMGNELVLPTDEFGIVSVAYRASNVSGEVKVNASIVAAPEKSASYYFYYLPISSQV